MFAYAAVFAKIESTHNGRSNEIKKPLLFFQNCLGVNFSAIANHFFNLDYFFQIYPSSFCKYVKQLEG